MGNRIDVDSPSSLLPKWISIMKKVMSWRTTSSKGVRLGATSPSEPPLPRRRYAIAAALDETQEFGPGIDRWLTAAAARGCCVRTPGANCSSSDSAASATSSESRAIRLRKTAWK